MIKSWVSTCFEAVCLLVVSAQVLVWMLSTEQEGLLCISLVPNLTFYRKEIHAAWIH